MPKEEFKNYRKLLNKTQKQMASLLGISLKAIHSYEQGLRSIPPGVERQLLFFLYKKNRVFKKAKTCWNIKKCSIESKNKCPAWEFEAGKLCWFINGTVCDGTAKKNWQEKMAMCRYCEVFENFIKYIV